MNIFGNTDALIGSIDLAIGAVMVLGAFIARKAVNDQMGQDFSVIGASACGVLSYLVVSNIFSSIKFSVGLGLAAWIAGGFLLAQFIGDGQSSS